MVTSDHNELKTLLNRICILLWETRWMKKSGKMQVISPTTTAKDNQITPQFCC